MSKKEKVNGRSAYLSRTLWMLRLILAAGFLLLAGGVLTSLGRAEGFDAGVAVSLSAGGALMLAGGVHFLRQMPALRSRLRAIDGIVEYVRSERAGFRRSVIVQFCLAGAAIALAIVTRPDGFVHGLAVGAIGVLGLTLLVDFEALHRTAALARAPIF